MFGKGGGGKGKTVALVSESSRYDILRPSLSVSRIS